jgi:hypothetical protein
MIIVGVDYHPSVKRRNISLIADARNIKGAHFAVGCGYSYHHLPKGAPL